MIQTSFFPEDEPIEIIPVRKSFFPPKKLEEVLPHVDIIPDTYILYPTGGYHPFYGVPDTLPRYQEPIWPYIKRIKFHEKYKNRSSRNNARRGKLPENCTVSQLNATLKEGYPFVNVERNATYKKNDYTRNNSYASPKKCSMKIHRVVAFAYIPNPEDKPFVLHKNDDSSNYLIENLKWGTPSENMKGRINKRPWTIEQTYANMVTKGIIKG
jgi:hypothetical protein